MDDAGVPDVVRALCLSTGHPHYAMAPAIAADSSKITVSLAGSKLEVWSDGLQSLELAGVRGSCSSSRRATSFCRFDQAPPPPEPEKRVPALVVFDYSPQYRDVGYLVEQLGPMFGDWKFAGGGSSAAGAVSTAAIASGAASTGSSSSGGGPSSGSAHAVESVAADLVAIGPASERDRLEAVLARLDAPVVPIVVRLAVYEVDVSSSDQSAINVVGKIVGSSVALGASTATTLATSGLIGLNVDFKGFSGVAAALDSSNDAHLVTAPVLRTSSGVPASAAVGDSVPTLSSVNYVQGSSSAIQSVEYQQSGVIFSVLPTYIGGKIDVALYQSISSFSATTVGVTSSPTLSQRALSSDLVVAPGQTVILGGLMQRTDSKTTSGWFFLPRLSHDNEKSRSDLVLVLSADVAR